MTRSIVSLLLLVLSFSLSANPYVVNRFLDAKGKVMEEISIPGIPAALRVPGPIASPSRSAVILNDVPKLNWSYGCTATAAAMMAGYYDRNGYPNMYAGPTHGSVFPINNSIWGYGECPLSATHQGFDGLASPGHVDRYWTASGNSGDDPFGTGDPTANYANCTGDYMGTNQDWWSNSDGASTIFSYPDGSPLYDYAGNESSNPRKRDAIHGLRLFMESRAYSVSTNYNQKIQGFNGNTQGYTLAQFQQSIDNGIPVMIQIVGHTMLGVGYESTSSTIYVHDTWDHNLHQMTWGGSYSNAEHQMVSVIELSSAPAISQITWNPAAFEQSLELNANANQSLSLGNTGTARLDYECSVASGDSNVLAENFTSSSLPAGWTEELVSGSALSWGYHSGGYSGHPAAAHEGSYNARLYKNSFTPSVVKLISTELNLQSADSASLSFWHTQDSWDNDQDELRVFYRSSASAAWNLLASYTDDISVWTQRSLALPNLSDTYYIAFEGKTYYGYGVCLDEITVSAQSPAAAWLTVNGLNAVSASIASGAANHSINIGFDASGLSAGSYDSSITILNNSGNNDTVSIPVHLSILAGLEAPQEPTITPVAGSNRARIAWQAVSGNISGYKLYFCAEPSFTQNVNLLATVSPNRTYYVDLEAGLRPRGFYRIIAYR